MDDGSRLSGDDVESRRPRIRTKGWSRRLDSLIRQAYRLTAGIYLRYDLTAQGHLPRAPDALCHELSALPARPWPARSAASASAPAADGRLAAKVVAVASSRTHPSRGVVVVVFTGAPCLAVAEHWPQSAASGWAGA